VSSAAPAGLAATASATALDGLSGTLASTAATSTMMLAKGALKAMFIAKVKTVSLTAAACLLLAGTGVVAAKQLAAPSTGSTSSRPQSVATVPQPALVVAERGADPLPAVPAVVAATVNEQPPQPVPAAPASTVPAFSYRVGRPYVANHPYGTTPDLVVLIPIQSVATVAPRTGTARVHTVQNLTPERLDVVATELDAPFVSIKGEKPRRTEVPEKQMVLALSMLNLAMGESLPVRLRFQDATEEFALSYGAAAGLQLTPVSTKYYAGESQEDQGRNFGRFRQLETVELGTIYCVSSVSLAARRGNRVLWQVPITAAGEFPGYAHPPESIGVEGDAVVLRTHVPKAGMVEPTELVICRYRKTDGKWLGRDQGAGGSKETGTAIDNTDTSSRKEQLERDAEMKRLRHD